MLTYLINVTGDLSAICLVIGVVLAYADTAMNERNRAIVRCGVLLGLVVAGIRAYITNTRRLVGGWKVGVYGYAATLIIFVCFVVFLVLASKKRDRKTYHVSAETGLAVSTGLILASFLYGALPNVYVYPFKFDIGSSGILSTDYLFRLGGYLLGIIICAAIGISAYRICRVADNKGYAKAVRLMFIGSVSLYTVYSFARLMLVLVPRKIINSKFLFKFGAASNNHAEYYTYIAMAALLALGIFLWIRSLNSGEVYRTNAEHRKQRAMWRTGKRFTSLALACLVMVVLCSTWFVKLNTVEIREAPVEDATIVKDGKGADETLVVTVDAVSDGHMHRFGYETDDGHLVRIIIVLKQEGTSNYGVGLDACDICGEAGYYENQDGQIVCKKCNVVMNRTTIGMKGGCNPIIIDYEFDGSQFRVPVTELVKYKDKFKNS